MDLEVIPQRNDKHTGSFIFLHGATRTGKWQKEMFIRLLGEKASFNHIKTIFPTSPVEQCDIKNKVTNSWFNVKKSEKNDELLVMDLFGIDKSVASVEEIIAQEQRNGIPINRIVLGGISQGGILALHAVYRFNPEIAGCIAVSSFIPHVELFSEAIEKHETNPPLLIIHGEKDEIIPIELGRKTYEKLKPISLEVEFEEFPETPHELTQEELELIIKKVDKLLPEN